MEPELRKIIDLVHLLDDAKRERQRAIENYDAVIARLENELRQNALGRSIKSVTEETYADKIYHALSRSPGCDYATLAQQVYGEDSDANRARLRAQITFLASHKRVRRLGRGRWEAVPPLPNLQEDDDNRSLDFLGPSDLGFEDLEAETED